MLTASAKNEIRLLNTTVSKAADALGSRIGGRPAVPPDFVWPYYEGRAIDEEKAKRRPLAFLAQINLREAASSDVENLLPKSGMLSFFYELETMTWGYDPSHKGSARVFYFPNEAELSIAEYPDELGKGGRLAEQAIRFESHVSLPDFSVFEDEIEFDEDGFGECYKVCGCDPDDWGEFNKLLGYPDILQGPMEADCETVARGYATGGPEDVARIPDSEKRDIQEKAKEWMLLFQMGSDPDGDDALMFDGCGYIYFWIKKSDLLKRDFDHTWLILECD